MKPIQIWRFDDAPAEYREIAGHGGDEEFLAFVPGDWMEARDEFGSTFDIDEILSRVHWDHPRKVWHPDGLIYSWAHA